jgi:uncharacterized protein YqcC (DUF446 family)
MQKDIAIKQKVKELSEALKEEGLWKQQEPAWVHLYASNEVACEPNFVEWLQFIYLPNLLKEENKMVFVSSKNYIAPQAMQFFGEEVTKGKLLQLMVELDSLTD